MNDSGNKATTGACGKPCPHPPDEMKLSLDITGVAADLASLAHCRYKLAGEAIRKFRVIRGIRLLWQAHCSHRLMLDLFRESKRLMRKAEKEMQRETALLLKKAEGRLAQQTPGGDSSTRADAGRETPQK